MALFLSCEDEFPFDGSFLTDVARPRYHLSAGTLVSESERCFG
jgi:hypothetical protein